VTAVYPTPKQGEPAAPVPDEVLVSMPL